MTIQFSFADKVVLVIGGTSGINLGIAQQFAGEGAKVAVASRAQHKVDSAVASLQQAGARAACGFSADVRDVEALSAGIAEVYRQWGEFDIVISGAAGNFVANAADMSANAFKAVIDIDLLGTFNVMKAVYPYLKKPGASVINISAPQAFIPMHAQAHVCSAKAGVDMVTRCLALEWGGEGIRLNAVVPGPIENTEGMKRLAPDANTVALVTDSVPLGRLGTAQDIANACLFLSSDFASYISGTVLPVDGGWAQSGAAGMAAGLAKFSKQAQ